MVRQFCKKQVPFSALIQTFQCHKFMTLPGSSEELFGEIQLKQNLVSAKIKVQFQ